jgi:transcription initiation factor TFIIB
MSQAHAGTTAGADGTDDRTGDRPDDRSDAGGTAREVDRDDAGPERRRRGGPARSGSGRRPRRLDTHADDADGAGGRVADGDARTDRGGADPETDGCPECGGSVDASGDETVCRDCGLVVGEYRIDHGPEWRSFADDDTNPERTGAPLTDARHDRGLSTEIGRSSRTKGRKRRQWARMRRQHNRARISTKRERNQVYAFTEVRRLVSVLSLPDQVQEHACALFRSAQQADLLRGRSLEGFAAATVYAACRVAGVARTVEEVAEEARADQAEQEAAYDAMNRELGLPTGPVDPVEYVPRFASKLNLAQATVELARSLARETVEAGIAGGRDPSGVAAACLYTAARRRGAGLTQQAAADVADVTPVTVRNTYVDLRERAVDADGEGAASTAAD